MGTARVPRRDNGPCEDGRGELVGDFVLRILVAVKLHTHTHADTRTPQYPNAHTKHAHTCTRAHRRAAGLAQHGRPGAAVRPCTRVPLEYSSSTPLVPQSTRGYNFRPPLRQRLRPGGSASARAPSLRRAAPQQRKVCLRLRCALHARAKAHAGRARTAGVSAHRPRPQSSRSICPAWRRPAGAPPVPLSAVPA